jgi:hypothetical protein
MIDDYHVIKEEVEHLASQFYSNDMNKHAGFTSRLLDIYTNARDKDFLLIHNPGGWGTTPLERSLQWERSIVEGVHATIDKLGYTSLLRQYFRTGHGLHERILDIREQACFFFSKAKLMAAELKFITEHLKSLQVIIIGVSQGAAFSNAVMQSTGQAERITSIELGLPFPYKNRREITENTLAVDSNGLMPDAVMEWNIFTMLKMFSGAPFRWVKYRLQGKRIKLSYCVNMPGHDYNWEYPEVQRQIEEFLYTNFGYKENVEVDVI